MKHLITVSATILLVADCVSAAAAPSAERLAATAQTATPYTQTSIAPSQLVKRDGIQLLDSKPYTGVVLDRFADGSKKARYSLQQGKVEGVWIEWYQNGPVRFYSEWRNGRGDGPFVYFHKTGEVSERVRAIGDVWDGVSEGWDESGNKLFELTYQNGKPVTKRLYDTDSKAP
jgi:hypothetical protein